MNMSSETAQEVTFSPESVEAYRLLQERSLRARTWISVERLERALDDVIRKPSRTGDPQKLANAAWGNAGKVVRDRATHMTRYNQDVHDRPEEENVESLALEIQDSVDRSQMTPQERVILHALLEGWEATDIAQALHLPLNRVAVLISRTRKRARRVWTTDV